VSSTFTFTALLFCLNSDQIAQPFFFDSLDFLQQSKRIDIKFNDMPVNSVLSHSPPLNVNLCLTSPFFSSEVLTFSIVCSGLAPQYPFPCALLDAFASYLFLIDPPSGSGHSAIHPSKIILSGDSAGGGLALSVSTFFACQ